MPYLTGTHKRNGLSCSEQFVGEVHGYREIQVQNVAILHVNYFALLFYIVNPTSSATIFVVITTTESFDVSFYQRKALIENMEQLSR